MTAPDAAVANLRDVEPLVDLDVFEAVGRALVATASDSDELARAEQSSRGSRLRGGRRLGAGAPDELVVDSDDEPAVGVWCRRLGRGR